MSVSSSIVQVFSSDKGHGVIAPDNGGKGAFVPVGAVGPGGLSALSPNHRIGYAPVAGRGGRAGVVDPQQIQAPHRDASAGRAHPFYRRFERP